MDLVFKPVPAALKTTAQQVQDRIQIYWANTNQTVGLTYPLALISDKTAPVISDISADNVMTHTVDILWSTDEFAKGGVQFGVTSNQYTATGVQPLYAKAHKAVLSNLQANTTYYYQVSVTGPER